MNAPEIEHFVFYFFMYEISCQIPTSFIFFSLPLSVSPFLFLVKFTLLVFKHCFSALLSWDFSIISTHEHNHYVCVCVPLRAWVRAYVRVHTHAPFTTMHAEARVGH